MFRPTHYEVTAGEILATEEMSDEEAVRVSRALRLTHTAIRGYYANGGPLHGSPNGERMSKINQVAHELLVRVVENPPDDRNYQIAPYCIEQDECTIRGVALWEMVY